MSIVEELHVGDIGTTLKVLINDRDSSGNEAPDDISAATTKQLILRNPSGTSSTKTASFTSDGSDGYIEYVTVEGDLDEAGDWIMQGYIVTPSGSWHTDKKKFKVHSNL